MAPLLSKATAEGRIPIPIKKFDAMEAPQVTKAYNVTAVPTFIIVDPAGAEITRTTGGKTIDQLISWINSNLQ